MVAQAELFLFAFWKSWRHQKDISKLTALQMDGNVRIFFSRKKYNFSSKEGSFCSLFHLPEMSSNLKSST